MSAGHRPDYAAIDAARLAAARAGLPREDPCPWPRLDPATRERYQRRPYGRAADPHGSSGTRLLRGPHSAG